MQRYNIFTCTKKNVRTIHFLHMPRKNVRTIVQYNMIEEHGYAAMCKYNDKYYEQIVLNFEYLQSELQLACNLNGAVV